jgi:pimeloyl-ACP methyl ester carboxylesterase
LKARWLERDGVQFAYELHGEGSCLLVLHGPGGDRAQASALVGFTNWRLLSIDLRAHGDTEPVGRPDAFSFSVFAADVVALLDRLNIADVVVVGVSMGAGVAIRLAVDHPHRVRGVACMRPAWMDSPLPTNLAPFIQIADLLRRVGPEAGLAAFRLSATYRRIEAVSAAAAASLSSQFLQRQAVERAIRLEKMPASVPFEDRQSLSLVRVPSLVVGCKRDPLHPLAIAREWATRLGVRPVMVTPKADDPTAHVAEVQAAVSAFLRRSFASPNTAAGYLTEST